VKQPWHSMEEDPQEQGIGANEPLLMWHQYNGVLVEKCRNYKNNRFYTHWTRTPDKWNDPKKTLPERSDADIYGCVIVRRVWGEILEMGWRQVPTALHINGWAQNPPAPRKE